MVPIPFRLGNVEIGRDHDAFATLPDPRLSRRHLAVRFDERRFNATELGSRNGTFVDGEPLRPEAPRDVTRVVRAGDSLLVVSRDIGPCERLGVHRMDGRVEGPALQEALQAVSRAAQHGTMLHITGESGAGKEGLARAFHASGPGSTGAFVAVNCATIPEGVAERLLFGAKKGAYSGADTDADGYIQAAHGGTLFLDEVAELSLAVQAKLLRVLETGEVLPLGAAKPRKVDVRFCSATHRDLRVQVAAGKLREDLYYRIAMPRVSAPPLRDRAEEIPWLLSAEIMKVSPDLTIHVSLVETCLLRPWPGNVRELLAEARNAAQTALSMASKRVEARHLSSTAGSAFVASIGEKDRQSTSPDEPVRSPNMLAPSRARIDTVLEQCQGNISAAARELGVHRTQLKRWMERYGIDARKMSGEEEE
jgi:DNA-binding NtrC family response regulator